MKWIILIFLLFSPAENCLLRADEWVSKHRWAIWGIQRVHGSLEPRKAFSCIISKSWCMLRIPQWFVTSRSWTRWAKEAQLWPPPIPPISNPFSMHCQRSWTPIKCQLTISWGNIDVTIDEFSLESSTFSVLVVLYASAAHHSSRGPKKKGNWVPNYPGHEVTCTKLTRRSQVFLVGSYYLSRPLVANCGQNEKVMRLSHMKGCQRIR
jgi:hypothetical protein